MELSINIFTTLDGVMQGPGGPEEDITGGFDRGGWLIPHVDEDFGRIVDGWFSHTDALLLGRTTFQMMRTHWSQITDPDDKVATILNTYPKYVAASALTEEESAWQGTTVIGEDVVEQVSQLKARPGGELQVHGSWQLARTLHDSGLVDIYRLLVFPVVLGTGKRLFADGAVPSAFRVETSETTSAGVVSLTLRPTELTTGDIGIEDGREVLA